MKNHIIREILIIAAVSASLGLLYNSFIPNSLPIIPKDKSELVVNDSALFGSVPAPDTAANAAANPALSAAARDSVVKAMRQDSINRHIADSVKAEKMSKITPDKLAANKAAAGREFKIVTYEQMKRIVKSPGFFIIDARRPDQYSKGKIANAVNIFPYDEQSVYVPKLMGVDAEKTIIVYCDGGTCDLSHEVAKDLNGIYKSAKVFVYEGGWEEWSKKKGK